MFIYGFVNLHFNAYCKFSVLIYNSGQQAITDPRIDFEGDCAVAEDYKRGLSDDLKSPNETKADVHSSSRRMSGSTVLIIAIAVAAVVGLSFVLFRLWQKKKREEQYLACSMIDCVYYLTLKILTRLLLHTSHSLKSEMVRPLGLYQCFKQFVILWFSVRCKWQFWIGTMVPVAKSRKCRDAIHVGESSY
ncbi:hypothetical protein CTI12_AA151200 [Artemisia annua]|uniref:Uncharacterized protein n=1 Tax=Artemisia annua TaxID=35608 RepID=A0A2U1PHT4_ARTAN|nr:hypothetical protein CTI12_AA151200 [Artemisia annua]